MSLLLLTAAAMVPLSWEGRATVHAGGRTIAIAVRSRIDANGRVTSDSWPIAEGEARGLRRMMLDPVSGTGTLTRGGRTTALPVTLVREELAQYRVYRQFQIAAGQCRAQTQTGPGSNVIEIWSPGPPTAFRCAWNRLTHAANWVAGSVPPVRQDFRFGGHAWGQGTNSFPRRMTIKRDGRPFFDLTVDRVAVGDR